MIETGRDLVSGTGADAALTYGIAVGLLLAFGLWAGRGPRSAEAAGGWLSSRPPR